MSMHISINRLMEIPKRLRQFFLWGGGTKNFFFEFHQTKWIYARFRGF